MTGMADPDLASALNTQSLELADDGRDEQALAAIRARLPSLSVDYRAEIALSRRPSTEWLRP